MAHRTRSVEKYAARRKLFKQLCIFFPVLTVELYDLRPFLLDVEVIERPDVHGVQLWRCTRASKDLDSAGLAKVMFGDPGSELVSADVSFSRQQSEPLGCYPVM